MFTLNTLYSIFTVKSISFGDSKNKIELFKVLHFKFLFYSVQMTIN